MTFLEENPIHLSEKGARTVARPHASVEFIGTALDGPFMMKSCTNIRCAVFGHVVYSVTTRCPLCKWDLKSILPVSEIAPAPKADRASTSG